MDKKYGDDVREKRETKPFENPGIRLVRREYLQDENQRRKEKHQHRKIDGHNKLRRCAHCPQIGSQIDGVGNQDQQQRSIEHLLAIVFLHHGGNAFSGHRANARAGLLHRHQKGQYKKRRPQLPIAELRSGLGISRYPRRVVVRRAGDDPRARNLQKLPGHFAELRHR
jgi:hypothetical protein